TLDTAPNQMPNAWLARPMPRAETAAAPASGCASRVTAPAISCGIRKISSFLLAGAPGLGSKTAWAECVFMCLLRCGQHRLHPVRVSRELVYASFDLVAEMSHQT